MPVEVEMFQVRVGFSVDQIVSEEKSEAQAFMPSTSPRAAAIKALSLIADSECLGSRRFVIAVVRVDDPPVWFAADMRPGTRCLLTDLDPMAPWDDDAGADAWKVDVKPTHEPAPDPLDGLEFLPIDQMPQEIRDLVGRLGQAVEVHVEAIKAEHKKGSN